MEAIISLDRIGLTFRREGHATLGDLLFTKPGITGSEFAPGASSRPIIRGLDVNRVGIVENGLGGNGASDLGEDHFVPIDPLTVNGTTVQLSAAGQPVVPQAISFSNNNQIVLVQPQGVLPASTPLTLTIADPCAAATADVCDWPPSN